MNGAMVESFEIIVVGTHPRKTYTIRIDRGERPGEYPETIEIRESWALKDGLPARYVEFEPLVARWLVESLRLAGYG